MSEDDDSFFPGFILASLFSNLDGSLLEFVSFPIEVTCKEKFDLRLVKSSGRWSNHLEDCWRDWKDTKFHEDITNYHFK